MSIKLIKTEINKLRNPDKAKLYMRFFKTGKEGYGEGDVFLGLTVPQLRKIARKYYKEMAVDEIELLLKEKFHEYRFIALVLLMYKYKKGGEEVKEEIFQSYINNTKYINNWDLVDISIPNVVGNYLVHHPEKRRILYEFAESKNLWERRISIMATLAFIRENDFEDTLKLSEILLHDKHDLIHKAVGWMLREVGKRDQEIEEQFLNKHKYDMPRTMLRYAIEKFEEGKRQYYLKSSKNRNKDNLPIFK